MDTKLLPHLEYNEGGSATIVLLHGLNQSPHEYDDVLPHLIKPSHGSPESYHILAPYLPGHGLASSIVPFELPNAATWLAELIKAKAKGGQAHVVGLSAGGFAGVFLAKQHRTLVQSLFATGIGGMNGLMGFIGTSPYAIQAMIGLQYYMPEFMYQSAQRSMGLHAPDGMREESWANAKLSMLTPALESIRRDGWAVPLGVRSLIIAGGAHDSRDGTAKYAKEIGQPKGLSKACVVKNAVHTWDMQFPELFANGVRAWVEQTELPAEFEVLELE